MAKDLGAKTARLISDFLALMDLIEFVPNELEKRIIGRHGLVKVESLASIAAIFKNEIKRGLKPSEHPKIKPLERLLSDLRNDLDTGIRSIRNSMAGHLLAVGVSDLEKNWLFMGAATYGVLRQDLLAIDAEFRTLDPSYPALALKVALPQHFKAFWSRPDILGPPDEVRAASMQTALWTPDIVAVLPSDTPLDDASIRVIGLRLSFRQLGLILLPFWGEGGVETVYERLLFEMSVNDYFALEEAIYTGNERSDTPSLINVWTQATPSHQGASVLAAYRAQIPAVTTSWKDQVRNKITAHMDPEIELTQLETSAWPIDLTALNAEINRLCNMLGSAARLDSRTSGFLQPPFKPNQNAEPPRNIPKWRDA